MLKYYWQVISQIADQEPSFVLNISMENVPWPETFHDLVVIKHEGKAARRHKKRNKESRRGRRKDLRKRGRRVVCRGGAKGPEKEMLKVPTQSR